MRNLFKDKYNSLFHFLFGILSYKFFIIIPLFILYQSLESLYFFYLGKIDENLIIDLSEFFIGYSICLMLNKF
jgi:hypothetical protein